MISRAVALILVAALFTAVAYAMPSTSAKSHILMDADTGRVISAKQEHSRSLIASTTKIMTAVVVLEQCDITDQIVISPEAVGIEGSSLYLKAGERMSISDLLFGMMLHSGNDAAVALAIACSGSVLKFVETMNSRAEELGLEHTHFENPNGLDGKEHYSTAYDLALLTRYALKLPHFQEIVSKKEVKIGNRALRNHNRLLWMMDGIIGVKTGYTKAAGRILVSAARQNGRTLIAVTICDGNDWHDHMQLFSFGYSLYERRRIISSGQIIGRLPVMDGSVASLSSMEDHFAYVMENEMISVIIRYPRIALDAQGIVFADVYIGDLCVDTLQLKWEK